MDDFDLNDITCKKNNQDDTEEFILDDLLLDEWSTMSPKSINSMETNIQRTNNSDHDSDSGLGIYSSSNSPKIYSNENFLLNNQENLNYENRLDSNQTLSNFFQKIL